MIQRIKKSFLAIQSLTLIALCAILSSFSENIGGESYTIFLNDKLMIQQHVSKDAAVKTLSLNESSVNDVLKVNYSHCGKIGTARNITIKDSQNKILKEWHFPDVVESSGPSMTFGVKHILAAQKVNKQSKLNLVYTSTELPEGKILATISINNDVKASLK